MTPATLKRLIASGENPALEFKRSMLRFVRRRGNVPAMDLTNDPEAIRRLLTAARRIAVVGCSPKPERDSHQIAKYLIDADYDVIPVNPGQSEILGRKCHPDVKSIPAPVDIVDVFRSPEHVPPIVEEAIAAKAKSVWLQLGARNDEAARRAVGAGLDVVNEGCIRSSHKLLHIPPSNVASPPSV